jgi:hypothetical protein
MEVTVVPLIIFAAPLNVCTPVPRALNTVALFVKFPPKAYVLLAPFPVAGSVHEAPELSVRSPKKRIALAEALVDANATAPPITAAPFTVNGRLMAAVAPLFRLNNPNTIVVPEEVIASRPPLSTVTVPVTVQFAVVVRTWAFWIINTSPTVVKLAGLFPPPSRTVFHNVSVVGDPVAVE